MDESALGADKGGGLSVGARYTSTDTAIIGGIQIRRENATSGNLAGYMVLATRGAADGDATARISISSTGIVTVAQQIQASSGTAGAPGYSFTGDSNLGMYRVSADILGLEGTSGIEFGVSQGYGSMGTTYGFKSTYGFYAAVQSLTNFVVGRHSLYVDMATALADDASAAMDKILFAAATATVLGTTTNTRTDGVNHVTIEQITMSGGAKLINHAATLYIKGPPAVSGSVTIGTAYGLRIAGSTTYNLIEGSLEVGGAGGSSLMSMSNSGGGVWGIFGNSSTQQTITGSRGGNAALADLLTKLSFTGIIVDSTSA